MNTIYVVAGCSGSYENAESDRTNWAFGFTESLQEAIRITDMLNNKLIESIRLSSVDDPICSSVIKKAQKLMLVIDPNVQLVDKYSDKNCSFYYFYSVNQVTNTGV